MMLRRELLIGSAIFGATALLPRAAWPVRPEDLNPDDFDPFGPAGEGYQRIRRIVAGVDNAEPFVRWLWNHYLKTGDKKYAIWTVSYVDLWWQSLPADREERIRVARIGRKMAQVVDREVPRSAAGPFWDAAYWGFEALARGVLDFLQYVPAFKARLEEAWRRDPKYLYGSAYMALAKMYIKLPAFPMSIGSLSKGYEYLEAIRSQQETTYALWHVVYAEAEMIRAGKEAALKALEGIERVCPYDVTTQYTYELASYLRERFVAAIESGSYDRYTWDPLLEPVEALRSREFRPPRICTARG